MFTIICLVFLYHYNSDCNNYSINSNYSNNRNSNNYSNSVVILALVSIQVVNALENHHLR